MSWCNVQTNEYDMQAKMYPTICTHHKLLSNKETKISIFPECICNKWQNLMLQTSQAHFDMQHEHSRLLIDCGFISYRLVSGYLWTLE